MPRGKRTEMPKTLPPRQRGLHAKGIETSHRKDSDNIRNQIAELINKGMREDEIKEYIFNNFNGYKIKIADWMSGENRAKAKKSENCKNFREEQVVSKEKMEKFPSAKKTGKGDNKDIVK